MDPQLGVAVLQLGQFFEELVELGIGDDRGVLDVIPELVLADLFGEHLPATAHVGVDRIHHRRLSENTGTAAGRRYAPEWLTATPSYGGATAGRVYRDDVVEPAESRVMWSR